MEEGKVLISLDEYRELRGKAEMCNVLEGRLAAFRDYVNVKEYSIDRDVCGAILGFPVESKETGEKT